MDDLPPPYPAESSMPQPGPPPVVVQPTYVQLPLPTSFQPSPAMCSLCQQQIITRVEYVNGVLTWVSCGVIALFGGILGCCLIPFCCISCKDALHTCPRCGTAITTVKRC
ncbi:Lipopolysaccharide-induced tumor necrosis factor-alpha factor [Paragonimus heterotremus]|uniref:Lipopolysaccharide-induced tumor necrosis factor-alpha factor n=1 Tax=Paragonimus heterotremus TaxID=100268 RepID=A0A8J4TR20_9TREM|nr:Lipopolysaccharide-induced tumor necrosis factor-alpha factor [Paragonimus heterotremus]